MCYIYLKLWLPGDPISYICKCYFISFIMIWFLSTFSTIKQGNRIEHTLGCVGSAVGKDDGRCIAQGLHDVGSTPGRSIKIFSDCYLAFMDGKKTRVVAIV